MRRCPNCDTVLEGRPEACPACFLALERRGFDLRWLGLGGAALYFGQYVLEPATYLLTDYANLAIHEGGHLLFRPFGDLLYFLGGSITQVLFPLAFVIAFWRTGQRFSGLLCLFWMSNNLMSVSVYVRDAQAQSLDLVGGDTHDWNWILTSLGLLESTQRVGGLVYALGLVTYVAALGSCTAFLLARKP